MPIAKKVRQHLNLVVSSLVSVLKQIKTPESDSQWKKATEEAKSNMNLLTRILNQTSADYLVDNL